MEKAINHDELREAIRKEMKESVIPSIVRFVEIPNLSRAYDAEWDKNGLMQNACNMCIEFARNLGIKGLDIGLYEEPGKTPMVFGTIQATKPQSKKSMMFYGHIDKQPHLTEGWRDGLHPFKPIIENGLLYGRGGADDGYNFFTILSIFKILQERGIPHEKAIIFFETDEESSSRDILFWANKFKDTIGNPDIMFCLDSVGLDNKHVWITTTLRGVFLFDLKVKIIEKGVHSGMASGIVPSTMRIMRQLLARIEDGNTGELVEELQPKIPADKLEQATEVGKIQDEALWKSFSFVKTGRPATEDLCQAYIRNIWMPHIEVIGQAGIPDLATCGNVLRDETTFRISMRIPPNENHLEMFEKTRKILEANPPNGAEVTCSFFRGGSGWCSKEVPDSVMDIIQRHSKTVFNQPACFNGCGGSIPFIGLLQKELPETLLIVSGVALPESNIHGPNENLDLEYLGKFSEVLCSFVADF